MNPITALVDTAPQAAALAPFSPELELLRGPEDNTVSPFSSFFNAAVSVLDDTNRIAAEAQQMQLDFATGRLDDVLALQMAMSRMNDAVNFTSQITSRIIESYREIMRMQI